METVEAGNHLPGFPATALPDTMSILDRALGHTKMFGHQAFDSRNTVFSLLFWDAEETDIETTSVVLQIVSLGLKRGNGDSCLLRLYLVVFELFFDGGNFASKVLNLIWI